VDEWVLTCTDRVNPPCRTSRRKIIYDRPPLNYVCNVVMVFVALAIALVVASLIGKRERQWLGACDTSASAARFNVDFIRVPNACMVSKCPMYSTGKSTVGEGWEGKLCAIG
jgi:hypothetical protein